MPNKIHLNAFEMNCVGHLAHGMRVHPENNRHRYTDLAYWTELAELLERGRFDALFLADVVGVYDTYRVANEEAFGLARRVAREEGILGGISSGAAQTAERGAEIDAAGLHTSGNQDLAKERAARAIMDGYRAALSFAMLDDYSGLMYSVPLRIRR